MDKKRGESRNWLLSGLKIELGSVAIWELSSFRSFESDFTAPIDRSMMDG